LARGAAETLDQTFTGGLVKAGVQGNQALAKQAAINAAALGTGYIAGKAAVTAVGAAAKTGVVPRIVNKVEPITDWCLMVYTKSNWYSQIYRYSMTWNEQNYTQIKNGYSTFVNIGKRKSCA
jgi:hypothetical protein